MYTVLLVFLLKKWTFGQLQPNNAHLNDGKTSLISFLKVK